MCDSLWAGQQELAIPDWEHQIEWSGFLLFLLRYGRIRQQRFAAGLISVADRDIHVWKAARQRALNIIESVLDRRKARRYSRQSWEFNRDQILREKFANACCEYKNGLINQDA